MKKAKASAFIWRTVVHILIVALLGIVAYSNALDVPFHYDDRTNILENDSIKHIGSYSRLTALKLPRSIGYMSFALNYRLGGFDVTGYHVVNLFLHIINALLLYALVVLAFKTPSLAGADSEGRSLNVAFLSSLLFVSHPVQTQAVTYIVQRFSSLAAFFYLLSLVLYIKWRAETTRQSKSFFLFILSLLSAVLAMKSKETAFTLPFMLLAFEFVFFRNNGGFKRRMLCLLPFFLASLLIPLSLMGFEKPAGDFIGDVSETLRVQTPMSRWDYLFTEFRVAVTYLRLLFLPVNQNLDYDYPVYRSFFDPDVLLSFVFLSVLVSLSAYLFYRSKAAAPVSFGVFWFFIALLPESSVIPIADVISEHRLYLPSAGIFMAVSSSAMTLKRPSYRKALTVLLIAAALVFSYASYRRNAVWQSSVGLWEDVVGKSPNKIRGIYNLANAYSEAGMFEKAVERLKAVIVMKPDCAEAYNNLGVAYASMGRKEEAEAQFKEALKHHPGFSGAYFNLGLLMEKADMPEKAAENYALALKSEPDNLNARVNLGLQYISLGRIDLAIENLIEAVRIAPEDPDARYGLGLAYLKKGLRDEARAEFLKAIEIDPKNRSALDILEGPR